MAREAVRTQVSDTRQTVPKNVFIDTEAFIRNNFDFDGRRFASLLQLVESGEITIFLTAVTVSEVRSNIISMVMNTRRIKPDKVLRNSRIESVEALFVRVPKAEARVELLEQFERFLSAGDVEVLEVEGESLEKVLSDYFDRRPPFGDEKNKAEFPDAIAIDTIGRWCDENEEEMAIVTKDSGMASTCSDEHGRLRHFDSISSYLDAVLVPESDTVHEFILDMIEEHKDVVFRDVAHEFDNLGFVIVDQIEGDVEYAELLGVDFRDGIEVVRLENGEASIEVLTELEFRADIHYPEEGTSIYDSEEGRTFYPHWIADSVTRTASRVVGLDVRLDSLVPEHFSIEHVKLIEAADVELEAYPYSDQDLK